MIHLCSPKWGCENTFDTKQVVARWLREIARPAGRAFFSVWLIPAFDRNQKGISHVALILSAHSAGMRIVTYGLWAGNGAVQGDFWSAIYRKIPKPLEKI